MEVIPAIDIRGGKCVRLFKGDYRQETVYDDDPLAVLRRWENAGAPRVHIVDLDGARDGLRVNAEIVRALARAATVPLQLGGGIRDASAADEVLDLGVERVIFGTAALEAPGEVEHTVARHGPERVVVGVDARDGLVTTRGWLQGSGVRATDLIDEMGKRGVRRFMYTDTTRDGTLSHPNFGAAADLIEKSAYRMLIAGGIATVDDLLRLSLMGAEGAVTGRAIYSGAMDLRQAILAVSEQERREADRP